jgi:hypothetical protein
MIINSTYLKTIVSIIILLIINCYISKNLTAQGFSKPFNYRGDTQVRSDILGSFLLYHPVANKLFFPNYTLTTQAHSMELWRKTDVAGNVIASSLEEVTTAGGYQNLCGSFVWNDNSQFLSAGIYSNLGDTFQTFFLQQRDTNLQVVWRKEYPTDMDRVYPRAFLPISSSSNLLIINMGRIGNYDSLPQVTRNIVFLKTDNEGNELWRKRIDSLNVNLSIDAIYTPEHHILICGQTQAYGVTGNGGATILKLDTLGNIIWHKVYDKPGFDALEKIRATADGNYAAVGWTNTPAEIEDLGNAAGRILKIDTAGNVIWDKIIEISPRSDIFQALTLANNGDIIAVGSTYKYYAYDQYGYMLGSTREPDAWVVRMDLQGNEVWNRVFGHNAKAHAHEYLYSAVSLADGGFVMAGSTQINDTAIVDGQYIPYNRPSGWLVRLDENGCVDSLCSEITDIAPIAKQKSQTITIYPNPNKGYFRLLSQVPLAKGTVLQITNILGQTVHRAVLPQANNKIEVQLNHTAPGIYFITVHNEKSKETIKYIIN